MHTQRNTTVRRSLTTVLVVLALAFAGGTYYKHQATRAELTEQAEALLAKGIQLFEDERNDEALQVLESIPAKAAPDWRIPYYKGMALIQLKDYQPAANYLEASLALDNTQVATLFALGVTYFKLGKLSLSKSYFAAVLDIDPGNDEARGLMDTMARLERIQPGAQPADETNN